MKLKDYMIGDWILSEYDFPMQVASVGKDYLYADFYGNEGDVFEFDEKFLPKPIPLTEEILKTNDFRYGLTTDQEDMLACIGESCETHNSWVWENENGGVVSISFPTESDGGQLYCHNDHKNECIDTSYNWLKTIYIHQLQHALHLCGLDNLADNFKIE